MPKNGLLLEKWGSGKAGRNNLNLENWRTGINIGGKLMLDAVSGNS